MIDIVLALIAGILTIAAPCILLPLPIILGASVGQNSKTRPLFITLGFVLTFTVLALFINVLTQSLGLSPQSLRTVSVVLLALFGLFLIWPYPFELLMGKLNGFINQANKLSASAGSGNAGGLLIGVILGVIWTPCAGPILGAILTLIATQTELTRAGILLIAYALGAGIPMLIIAYGGQAISTKIKSIAKYSTRLQQIFGLVLLILAIMIYFQYDIIIQSYLVEYLPSINTKY